MFGFLFGGSITNKSLASTITLSFLLAPSPSLASTDVSSAAKAPAKKETTVSIDKSKDVVRLTKLVKPSAYELTVEPDLDKFTYSGNETITLSIAEPTRKITLNALDLTISSAEIVQANDATKKQSAKVEIDEKNEQAHLIFNDELSAGTYKLHITFNSILNDQLRGFYRSYYKDASGEKRWLCSTQFEPADARRMYPCFDEPEFKATFQLNAVIDPKLTALSNAPVDHVTEKSGKKVVSFEPTPKMSTYLMVLVVGDFKSTEERKSCDVPIRVWAPAGQEKMGAYSLGAACEIMTFLSEYFGIKFPAKKLDLIAIPDFAPGAMENLGAITFKDSLLLIDEKTGSAFARRKALSVIAHEMAHQWFGDLVTMRWWDDLWLNEAFATWAATKTENALRPTWRVRTKDMTSRNEALSIDQLASTRAIHSHVGNPKQASEMFDAITYDKGSAVLRMLEVFVGEKVFQKGVHDYLEKHKFDNATAEDLWQSIGSSAKGVPVPSMMETWILQPGFPLISTDSKNGNKSISLSQKRFFLMPGTSTDKSRWIVPVMLRNFTAGTKQPSINTPMLLDKVQNKFTLPASWNNVVVNAGASGFYRVLYTPAAIAGILNRFPQLTPEERLSVISDVGALSRKGSLPVETSLNLMLKVKTESDTVVLNRLVTKFTSPRNYIDDSSRSAYEKLIRFYLLPLKTKFGWSERKGEEETMKDLRADVLRILGTCGQDKGTIKEATDLYSKYLKDRQSISGDIVSTVLNIVAYNGGDSEYEQMKEALKKASNPQEEKRFLSALAQFRKPELIDKSLALTLSAETRATDGVALLSSLLGDEDSHEKAWKFTRANWENIQKKFPPRFNKRIVAACESFDTAARETELRQFFAAHPLEMGKAAVARMLEEVHISVLYRQRSEANIRKWVVNQAQKLSG